MKNIHIKHVIKTLFLLVFLLIIVSCNRKKEANNTKQEQPFKDLNNNKKLDVYEDASLPIEKRLQDLISKLTDTEKASLLIGIGMPGFDMATMQYIPGADLGKVPGSAGGTHAIERLGIPSVIVADGPAGLRINPKRDNDTESYYATAFPVGTALASTWNKELLNEVGTAMGEEVKAYGVDVLLGPGMNIHRNPLCGRNFEYYSEDPLLSGKLAAAMVNGIQSQGVGTSIKHFVANNQERNRLSINARISERAMREIYLRGFEITIKESQPWTIMTSYNLVNGTYTSARKDLLTTILRNEWGFKGLVMSDWFGGYEGFETISSKDAVSDVVKQLQAGNDLLMPGTSNQYKIILENIKNGGLTEEAVDVNLRRVLALALKSPSMNNYKYSNKPDLKAHAMVTRQVAAEGVVLLENKENTLPITEKSGVLAVFGNTSYDFISGGTGSGDVNEAYSVSLIKGLRNAGFLIDNALEELYIPYVEDQKEKEMVRREKEGGLLAIPKRIVELGLNKKTIQDKADSSKIALITIGRNAGENGDRQLVDDFNLAKDEVLLINNVSEEFHAQGKKVVVVLNIGGVIETASWRDKVDAILLPWQPGQEGGNSVADVITGAVTPSGKLTMTFPVNYEDAEATKNWFGTPAEDPKQVNYEEGVYVGYRYFNTFNVKSSYEFGYGLSYTTFDYSKLKLSSDNRSVSVTITNTGKIAGKEVVQLYLSAPSVLVEKPKRELKAFAKTKILEPGESQVVKLELRSKDLASFVPSRNAWVAESGIYNVLVGASSLNIKQTSQFTLEKEIVVEKTNPALELEF